MSALDPPPAAPHDPRIEIGNEFEVDVDRIAHGGHAVARVGEVVAFVRGALPGERVRISITDVRARFVRADVVAVVRAHPERRDPLCAVAGVCGGCDFQHASESLQQHMKLQVVQEALTRHGRIPGRRVEELLSEGIIDLGSAFGWRSRMRYRVIPGTEVEHVTAGAGGGVVGMHRHRSDTLVDASSCLIANPDGHRAAIAVANRLPIGSQISMSVGEDGPVLVVDDDPATDTDALVRHRIEVAARTFDFHVPVTGFWQVHPRMSQAIIDRVLDVATPRPGESWWDLYAGVGPIAAALGVSVGESGRVDAVESSADAVASARRTFEVMPWVKFHRSDVRRWLASRGRSGRRRRWSVDGVVLDPPRSGAGASVMRAVAHHRPRVIVIVACDPIALGRDTAHLAELGYHLASVRVWDAFPQTHHIETLATFEPSDRIS